MRCRCEILNRRIGGYEVWLHGRNQGRSGVNAAKCNIMRMSKKQTPISTQYELSGQVLEEVKDAKYLGLSWVSQSAMTWSGQSILMQLSRKQTPSYHS